MSTKWSLILCLLILVVSGLVACGPRDKPDPTPLPYTPKAWDTDTEDTQKLVGNPEAGMTIFKDHCSSCHSLTQGENIAGPSLYAAGDDLSYDYIKESIGYPHEVIINVENPQYVDTEMPNNYLEIFSDQQLEDIVAYILEQTKYGGTEKED